MAVSDQSVEENRPYHHGNLRSELLAAGLELTRTGGPDALSLREATRVVGVTPNAAYRHFTNRHSLLVAVAHEVQDRIAAAMLDHWPTGKGRRAARDRLRAVGLGYIEFALAEPGWFATLFAPYHDAVPENAGDAEPRVPPPYALLVQALDEMVNVGLLSSSARRDAEWSCWSAVHGFAQLATNGPLRRRSSEEIKGLAPGVVDAIIDGVLARR